MTFTRSYSFVRKRALQLLRVVIDRDWRCINSLLSIVVINQHCYHCWECLNFGAEYYTKNWDWNVSHLVYVKLNFRGFEFSYFRLNSRYWIANSIWIAVLDLKSTFSESKLRRLPCVHYVSFRSKLIGKKAKPTRHAKKIHLHAKCTKTTFLGKQMHLRE